jgi:hypothetical protein
VPAGSALLVDSLAAAGGRRKRAVWPAATAVSVVAAWLLGMAAVPWLMTPGAPSGPDGMALPAVQAYVSGLLPDAGPAGGAAGSGRARPAKPPAGLVEGAGLPGAEPTATPGGPAADDATVQPFAHGGTARAAHRPGGTGPTFTSVVEAVSNPVSVAVSALPTAATPAATVAVTTPSPAAAVTTVPITPTGSGSTGRPGKPARNKKPGKASNPTGTVAAAVPDHPVPKSDPTTAKRPARRQNGPKARTVTA